MKKIKSLKVFCIICSLTILLLCPAVTVSAQAAPSGEETIQPRAPIIKWVFKEENGIIYRRLYNYSTGEWIGDWIPCD